MQIEDCMPPVLPARELGVPREELYGLIRRAWADMWKAREQCDEPRARRAERRMNALLQRLRNTTGSR